MHVQNTMCVTNGLELKYTALQYLDYIIGLYDELISDDDFVRICIQYMFKLKVLLFSGFSSFPKFGGLFQKFVS